jgi:UDP-N-acetylmuramate: L-alanyl-gamma-D-glutamyl-meso-diaminopimelate ligase
MAKKRGWIISGSDQDVYPPISDFLRSHDLPCSTPHDPGNIPDTVDLAVVGKHVNDDNEELRAAEQRRIPVVSFPELMKVTLSGYHPIVIAGTYGKTSIAALTAWIFEQAGLKPGYLIGGVPLDLPASFSMPGEKGGYFIVEGDEYPAANFDSRSKFLFYRPAWAVVTSVDWDHINVFPAPDLYRKAFRAFVSLVPHNGFLLMGESIVRSEYIHQFSTVAKCDIHTYGRSDSSDWWFRSAIRDEGTHPGRTALGDNQYAASCTVDAEVYHRNKLYLRFASARAGTHNVENALAAVALARRAGIAKDVIVESIESYRGVKRRLETIDRQEGVVFIDDLAHHPAKVRATLSALKDTFPDAHIWAVFEPSTYSSRNRRFVHLYSDAFDGADEIVIMPVPHPEQIPHDMRITADTFKRIILQRKLGKDKIGGAEPEGRDEEKTETHVHVLRNTSDIAPFLSERLNRGDVVVFMSSGALRKCIPEVIERWRVRAHSE